MKINRRVSLLGLSLLSMACATHPATAPKAPTVPQARPMIPKGEYSIADYGAVADGKTLTTEAINKAIAAASMAGGGRVVIPVGRYLTGPFSLASNIELNLAKGATLLIDNNIEAYPLFDPPLKTQFTPRNSYIDAITATDCHDIAITGEGTIDGQGSPWWEKWRKKANTATEQQPQNLLPHRPQLVYFRECQRVMVSGVTLMNSPNFHLVPENCDDVIVQNVTFLAPANSPNTDALDPSGHRHVITGCTFDVGDDNIAIKPQKVVEGRFSCEDFLVTNCTFKRGHGLSVGGQTNGGLRRLTVRDCTFEGTDAGIRLKAGRGAGGLVEDVLYENLTMRGVKVPIFITSYYPTIPAEPAADPMQPVTTTTPRWRNITIRNVEVIDSPEAGRIIGLAEAPVENVRLERVIIRAKTGMKIIHAQGVKFVNSSIVPEKGHAVTSQNATITGMAPAGVGGDEGGMGGGK